MAFTIGTLFTTVPSLMANRVFLPADIAEEARKAILELTEDYKFPLLQVPGPLVQLQPGVNSYSPNYFMNVGVDQNLEINKVSSFFLYFGVYTPTGNNSGYSLKFSTIDQLEILMLTRGIPQYWTRFGDQIVLAMNPDRAYTVFMRYQKEHPFPNANTPTAGNDTILLPNSWQDIVEYATAMRLANKVRLFDIAGAMKTNLYGDPLFQRTGGTEGSPGLIFHRTSQEQRDQTTTTKSLRLSIRPIMR